MFSSYQLEIAGTHHRVSKTAAVPMQGRQQDWVVAVSQPGKGLLTTLP